MDHDLIRKQYDHEVERQDKIVSSLGLLVMLYAILKRQLRTRAN